MLWILTPVDLLNEKPGRLAGYKIIAIMTGLVRLLHRIFVHRHIPHARALPAVIVIPPIIIIIIVIHEIVAIIPVACLAGDCVRPEVITG